MSDNPCKIFVAGPRAVTKLNADVQKRLQSAIFKGHTFLVGDANGVDKAVQKYLLEEQCKRVTVYSSGRVTRNNLGLWPVKSVEVAESIKGFDFYAMKDMEMAKDTDYGFMIWNGKSRGTLNNLINLVNLRKTSLLYFIPHKKFYYISQEEDIEKILSVCKYDMQTVSKDLTKNSINQQITWF